MDRRRTFTGFWLPLLYAIAISLFVLAPNLIVIVISLNKGQYLIFPPKEWSFRWYGEAMFRPEWRNAFLLSLYLALITSMISTALGTLTGLALYRHNFRGKQLLSALFLSPLVLPGILLGLAILFFVTQLKLNGSFTALLLGHVLVTFPYVLRLILSALPSIRPSVEEAAATLGADQLTTMIRVTLPMIRSAVLSGSLFAFILSFDNVMMSLFLSSSRVATLPVKILQVIEWAGDPTIAAISTIFIFISLGLMILIDRLVGLNVGQEIGNR